MGFRNKNGAPYSASCVKSMMEGGRRQLVREQRQSLRCEARPEARSSAEGRVEVFEANADRHAKKWVPFLGVDLETQPRPRLSKKS
jgi:hypothetical protein